MRILRGGLLFVFVLICAAGWGLSPAAREKILQLKEKYRQESGAAGSTGFRETARELREKLQKQPEKMPQAEAAESVAAVTVPPTQEITVPPASAEIIPAEAEMQFQASQPQIIAESFEAAPSAHEPEKAQSRAADFPETRAGSDSKAGLGEFVAVMAGLVVLLSLSGHLARPLLGSMGLDSGMKGIVSMVVGGSLVLGIMFLLTEIWQKHLPMLAIVLFCMACPKGLDRSASSAFGCMAMLAVVVFLMPVMLAGNFVLYVVFSFLALCAMSRRR